MVAFSKNVNASGRLEYRLEVVVVWSFLFFSEHVLQGSSKR